MLILGGTLFDGTETTRIEECGIRIDDGRFTAVGSKSDFSPAGGEQVIDATGLYLMPGLVDMHLHVSFSYGTGGLKYGVGSYGQLLMDIIVKSPPETTIAAGRTTAVMLAKGVTTARDLAGSHDVPVQIRDAINRGEILGPRLVVCGKPIVITGGHAWNTCIEADGTDGFRKAARELLKSGVDYIKVMASHDPWPMPGAEKTRAELSLAEMTAAFAEAHEWGRAACCHAMGSVAIARSLEAGVDMLEHGQYLTDRLAERMASSNVVLTPTLSCYDVQSLKPRPEFGGGEWADAHKVLIPGHHAGFAAALAAGVTMTVGTDAAGIYAEEVDLMRRLGMKAHASLMACTSNGARALQMEDQIGKVRPGLRADLVLLRSDPMLDAYALEQVELVIKDGRPHRPADIAYSDSLTPPPTMLQRASGSSASI